MTSGTQPERDAETRAVRRDTGLSLLVVDKSLAELGRIADRAVILERGRSVWHGPIGDVAGEVANTYLGV